jgi:hypothetical protein
LRVTSIAEALPTTEEERTNEARALLAHIREEQYPLLTTWERELVHDLADGKAATKIRLKELREIVKRLNSK